jgi:hypothetical protein
VHDLPSAKPVHVALVLAVGSAGADDSPPNLRLQQLPIPTPDTLTMRVRVAAADDPQPVESGPAVGDDSPDYDEILRRRLAESDVLGVRRSLHDKVTFRFNLGFGIDGGQRTNQRLISGASLAESDYEDLRVYGFGDAVIGTRGLGVPSLSTYLAAEFRFDEQGVNSGAIPTRFDPLDGADNVLIRSGYADVDGFFANKWLKPLRLRAGRQFKYGPAIAHFNGIALDYDTPAVDISLFSGTRVSLFDINYDATGISNEGLISGADFKVDIGRLGWLPIVITGSTMTFDSVTHNRANLAYRPTRNSLVGLGVRLLDGKTARQTFSLRTRISEVTTIKLEIDN